MPTLSSKLSSGTEDLLTGRERKFMGGPLICSYLKTQKKRDSTWTWTWSEIIYHLTTGPAPFMHVPRP